VVNARRRRRDREERLPLFILYFRRDIMAKKLNIKKAIKKPGQLHRDLGVPQGEKIPAKKIAAAAKKGGKIGQRARFAQTLKGFSKHGKK
jgi:hypothetical protein